MKFNPDEIIFAATEACNLHCPHCFVKRNPDKLNIETAKKFLDSCINADEEVPHIEKIGFSGGEPFLYFDFIIEITKYALKHDLMFDQIMTNGDWWKTKDELNSKLQSLYDAGYDGKIGLSWDIFHNQDTQRIITFIETVIQIFGPDSINIQTVTPNKKFFKVDKTSVEYVNKKLYKKQIKQLKKVSSKYNVNVYFLDQTLPPSSPYAWEAKEWFKEDYCEGPGHILYVHPTGDIAPCCGFANENKELFIGNITDTYEHVYEKAMNNTMVNLCYEKGLSSYKDEIKNSIKGKCDSICTFCEYACSHYNKAK